MYLRGYEELPITSQERVNRAFARQDQDRPRKTGQVQFHNWTRPVFCSPK
jgi:hypothetical protein